MKKVVFLVLILFSIRGNAQSDTLLSVKRSVISLDKVKTVYRGILNPISIAVADCKSFSVEGIGLREESKGKYTIAPGAGNQIKILVKITNFDDSISIEEHLFKIANIPSVLAKINNKNCSNCLIELTKKEIKNAMITIGFNDIKFDIDFEGENFQVYQFSISINGLKDIIIEGNKFSEESMKVINKLKNGTEFYILDVRYPNPNDIFRKDPQFIKIRLKE